MDPTYSVVGAASLSAQVPRDTQIAALGPVGSGHPSGPKTRARLQGYFTRSEPLPACVRQRWGAVMTLRQQSLIP